MVTSRFPFISQALLLSPLVISVCLFDKNIGRYLSYYNQNEGYFENNLSNMMHNEFQIVKCLYITTRNFKWALHNTNTVHNLTYMEGPFYYHVIYWVGFSYKLGPWKLVSFPHIFM